MKIFDHLQEHDYEQALLEIRAGRKISHWMWYIFPQIKGLGFSETSKFYAINDINEANEYLNHSILGLRLREISAQLLELEEDNANTIFGSPDDMKLKSSMTLFSAVDTNKDNVFQKVIEKYFDGNFDKETMKLLKE